MGKFRPSDHSTNDFPVVQPGNYLVVISEVERRFSKSGGDPYLNIKAKIIGGRSQNGESFNGQNLFFIVSLKAAALFKLGQLVIATGADPDVEFDLDDDDEIKDILMGEQRIGKGLIVETGTRDYNGKQQTDVLKFLPMNNPDKYSAKQIANFERLVEEYQETVVVEDDGEDDEEPEPPKKPAKAANSKAAPKKTTSKKAEPEDEPQEDDDIPF